MLVIPAIDIKGGRVVRLLQGKYEEETIYSDDPVSVAMNWQDKGAMLIHIVDLDGALMGELKNIKIVEKIVKSITVPVELGGGIRSKRDISLAMEKGISRVVLGTKACTDEQFIKEMVVEFGERIIASIDAKYERVATSGWTATEQISATELARKMEELGVRSIIYTDISRDGTLRGPNIDGITRMLRAVNPVRNYDIPGSKKDISKRVNIPLIASGGISCLEDIRSLKKLEKEGLLGVIAGKALYEGRIDLAQAIEVANTDFC